MTHYYFDKNKNSVSLLPNNAFIYLKRKENSTDYSVEVTTQEQFASLNKSKFQYFVIAQNKISSLPKKFFEQNILKQDLSLGFIKQNRGFLDKKASASLKYEDIIQLELLPINQEAIAYICRTNSGKFILRALRKKDFMRLTSDPSTKAKFYWPLKLSQLQNHWLDEQIFPNFTLSNSGFTQTSIQHYFESNIYSMAQPFPRLKSNPIFLCQALLEECEQLDIEGDKISSKLDQVKEELTVLSEELNIFSNKLKLVYKEMNKNELLKQSEFLEASFQQEKNKLTEFDARIRWIKITQTHLKDLISIIKTQLMVKLNRLNLGINRSVEAYEIPSWFFHQPDINDARGSTESNNTSESNFPVRP